MPSAPLKGLCCHPQKREWMAFQTFRYDGFQRGDTMSRRIVLVYILMSLWLLSTTSPYAQPSTIEPALEEKLTEARRISNNLAEKVRTLLLNEIGKGGFPNAIRVCSELAREITRTLASQTGHDIRRVSLKYRNHKNIPDDHERKKLGELERLNRLKRLPEESVEVIKEKGGRYLRYMKPLVIAPLCITCHGPIENIPSEVQDVLREKYPEDRATGFLVGDLRGAISVKIQLDGGKR